MIKVFRDPLLGAAFIAAPVFWIAWFLYLDAEPNWEWPLASPRQFLLLAIIYPILEEFVFRGALQGWLRKRDSMLHDWRGLTLANVITSAAFSVFHLFRNSVGISIAVFAPSMIFGFFRDRYDHLHTPIALHIFYNAGFVWLFLKSGLP